MKTLETLAGIVGVLAVIVAAIFWIVRWAEGGKNIPPGSGFSDVV